VPVQTPHPSFAANVHQWTKCRCALEGEDAIKGGGETYLAKLSGQDDNEYHAYRERAMYYDATDRTVQGLVGAVTHEEPEVTFPKGLEDSLDHVGGTDVKLETLLDETLREVIGVGRLGLYVDAEDSENAVPYVCTYYAENIINWKEEIVDGKSQLVMVVLREHVLEQDSADAFKFKEKVQYRVLWLEGQTDGSHKFRVDVWVEKETDDNKRNEGDQYRQLEPVYPRIKGGKFLEFIPFTFISPSGTGCGIEKSPILGLVNMNISHYRTSADLEHGRHFSALPTACVFGYDADKNGPLRIGSATAWTSSDPAGSASFLEFTGAGLGSLVTGLQEKEKLMAVLGARMLEVQKRTAESAETVKLRHSGETSILSKLAIAVEQGLSKVLKWYALWLGAGDVAAELVLNKDYTVAIVDPIVLQTLLQALQQGAMSWKVWFFNLQKAGLTPDDLTEDTEKQLIRDGRPEQPPGVALDAGATDPIKRASDAIAQRRAARAAAGGAGA
jgi:hypothetical protein